MKTFWKKKKVKNYFKIGLEDIDNVVESISDHPDYEKYKIKRIYYRVEFIDEKETIENAEFLLVSKEEYENHKDDNKNQISYHSYLNYEEFIDEFCFEEFEQFLFQNTEPVEQHDFISCVNKAFDKMHFEGQAKLFLRNVIFGIGSKSRMFNQISNAPQNNKLAINKIQKIVAKHYSNSYVNTKNTIINIYQFIYPEIINEFKENDEIVNIKLTREEILKKLIGDNKNIEIYFSYEKILKLHNYLSIDYIWIKKASNLSRFYSHCINKKIFKSYFYDDNRGIDLLRQLYDFHDGTSIDTKSKRNKQLTRRTMNEFDFLDLK